jgi:hypothetical protein
MADMGRIVGAVIAIAVSVIVISTILAPTISDAIGTSSAPGALAEYSGLLGAVIVMVIVGVLMVAVKLISSKM